MMAVKLTERRKVLKVWQADSILITKKESYYYSISWKDPMYCAYNFDTFDRKKALDTFSYFFPVYEMTPYSDFDFGP